MGQLCSSKTDLVFEQTWRCEWYMYGRHGCCGEATVIPAVYAPWLDIWGCAFISLRARCEDTERTAAGRPEGARVTAYLGRNRAIMRATATAVPSRCDMPHFFSGCGRTEVFKTHMSISATCDRQRGHSTKATNYSHHQASKSVKTAQGGSNPHPSPTANS
jgi:hypothetical protein